MNRANYINDDIFKEEIHFPWNFWDWLENGQLLTHLVPNNFFII